MTGRSCDLALAGGGRGAHSGAVDRLGHHGVDQAMSGWAVSIIGGTSESVETCWLFALRASWANTSNLTRRDVGRHHRGTAEAILAKLVTAVWG